MKTPLSVAVPVTGAVVIPDPLYTREPPVSGLPPAPVIVSGALAMSTVIPTGCVSV